MTGPRAWLRAQWYRLMRDPDPYPPEAAEAPDRLGCGCKLGALTVACMHCKADGCGRHFWPHTCPASDQIMAVADAVREDQGDVPVQRAEPWPPAKSPAIVAADDISTYQASAEIDELIRHCHAAWDLYRERGLRRFGGTPELRRGTCWTEHGWTYGRRCTDGR